MKDKKKLLFWLIFFLTVFNIGLFLGKNFKVFLDSFDVDYWQSRYEKSQWIRGYEAEEPMGDGELYAYAGWRQIQGMDPTEINAEQPPVGKYLLGLSILVFKNPVIIAPFLGLGVLTITFLIGREIFRNNILAILPVFLLSLDSLFRENLIIPMLDLPFAFFIATAFLFFILAEKRIGFFLPGLIFLSLATATKVHLAGFGLLASLCFLMILVGFLKKDKKYFSFFLFLPFFGLVYLLAYSVYLLKGNNFLDFKYLHFWIRHFARVRVDGYPKGEMARILFFGRWLTWWEGFKVVRVAHWNIFWPFSVLAGLVFSLKGLVEKNYPILLLSTWIFSFLLMYSLGVPYPRYLLPILPPLYIMLVQGVNVLILKNEKNQKEKK